MTPTQMLKNTVRAPFAFPGGAEKILITTDGGALCYKCAASEFKGIMHSTLFNFNDGWEVSGITLSDSFDGSLCCDHCARELNAYEQESES